MAITSHKVAASRDRNINIRIRISLFRFRVLMATSFHKVAAARIRGKKVSKPLLLTHCDIGSQSSRCADQKKGRQASALKFLATAFHKDLSVRIGEKGMGKHLPLNYKIAWRSYYFV